MDRLTPSQRHKSMAANKSKNTKIEVMLCKALWHKGVRYYKNRKVLDCHPDIVISKYKIAVFCDGDFWHGKDGDGSQCKTHTEFWKEKIGRNIERDLENTIELRDAGWTVLRFWESDIRKNLDLCVDDILMNIERKRVK